MYRLHESAYLYSVFMSNHMNVYLCIYVSIDLRVFVERLHVRMSRRRIEVVVQLLRACVRVCVRACVRACTSAYVCTNDCMLHNLCSQLRVCGMHTYARTLTRTHDMEQMCNIRLCTEALQFVTHICMKCHIHRMHTSMQIPVHTSTHMSTHMARFMYMSIHMCCVIHVHTHAYVYACTQLYAHNGPHYPRAKP